MHAPSPLALLVIAVVVLILFGRGKISSLMGEFGKGITAFKKGINDGTKEIEDAKLSETSEVTPPPVTPVTPVTPVPPATPVAPVQPTDKDKV